MSNTDLRRFRLNLPFINFPVVLRVIGLLLVIESVFLLLPLATCLYYGEDDWRAFLITLGITLTCGGAMTLSVPAHRPWGNARDSSSPPWCGCSSRFSG